MSTWQQLVFENQWRLRSNLHTDLSQMEEGAASSSSSSFPRALTKQPLARLICSICQEVFHDPVHVVASCCHCFCRKCIAEWNRNHNTCPICREVYISNVPLRSSVLVCELLEEVEVHCKYGVRSTSSVKTSSRFGVLGEDFSVIPHGCTVTLPLKDITKHEAKCSHAGFSSLKKEIRTLRLKNSALEDEICNLHFQNALLVEQQVNTRENYDYGIEDALEFAKVLLRNMDTGGSLEKNRCFIALQRLYQVFHSNYVSYDSDDRGNLHYLFYTAKKCMFWTSKQQEKIDSWFSYF